MNFPVAFDFTVQMECADLFKAGYSENFVMSHSYNDLTDKPTLNGETIQGDMEEHDPTVPEWAKRPEKPEYSAEDVGAIPTDAALGAGDLEYMWDTTEI